ncbi:MAG: type II toxin-antitoxin system VapC family toxin [Candidatus Tyrphobacter sp.]
MILLDTCAAVWMASAQPTFLKRAQSAIVGAAAKGELFISSISAWEIATLARRDRLVLRVSPTAFVNQLFAHPSIAEVPVDKEIALLAGSLPGEFHGDPADRLIVATAISHGMQLMTRDRRILAYAKQSNAVPAIPC